MILIIGLGNPGKKFQETRHNLGWLVLSLLQKKWEKEHGFSDWKEAKKLKSEISKGEIKGKRIILARPLTFMNLSGQATKLLTSYYKVTISKIIVIHDDIDISEGKIKIVKKRGTAGHKGIESIISELKTNNFARIRIGIKPRDRKPTDTNNFVLSRFRKNGLEKIIKRAAKAAEMIINEGVNRAMTDFNK